MSHRPSLAEGWGSEQGLAALGAMVSVVVLLCMLMAATAVADLLSARQRAAAAADLSALAAAPEVITSSQDACVRAQSIARENGARIVSCEVHGDEVLVRAAVLPRSSWARWIAHLVADSAEATALARAQMQLGQTDASLPQS
jgi:secretion/DNA translocation related TadE-like protein